MSLVPYYQDAAVTLYQGDALTVLRALPEHSVQTCITSPPYWGLRDYGTAMWEGGAAGCEHSVGGQVQDSKAPGAITTGQRPGVDSSRCRKCGARRIDAQLGLEPTPEQYVANLLAVFREVWRVLRDDGTLWVNLGDSYNAYNGNAGPSSGFSAGSAADTQRPHLASGHGLRTNGLKPKDLVGIPWRVAFALQADGWYLRSDIIWAKPNPMPESVTDRPTKSHEYLFLLSKNARYHYDAEAIKEPGVMTPQARLTPRDFVNGKDAQRAAHRRPDYRLRSEAEQENTSRNRRSVWEIATQPYPEAHFATFPVDLVKPCVLAGSRPGDTVLDPFVGSGTTCYVAKELGRRAIGIDLNAAYLDLAAKRLRQEVLF